MQRIYHRAELVVVFLSSTYHNSRFCYNEWRAIRNRFFVGFEDQQRERLLLVRLGDFVPNALGLFADDFYIDGITTSDEDIADIIVSRWRQVEHMEIVRNNDGVRRTTGYIRRWLNIPPEVSFLLFLLSLLFFILSLVLAHSS